MRTRNLGAQRLYSVTKKLNGVVCSRQRRQGRRGPRRVYQWLTQGHFESHVRQNGSRNLSIRKQENLYQS